MVSSGTEKDNAHRRDAPFEPRTADRVNPSRPTPWVSQGKRMRRKTRDNSRSLTPIRIGSGWVRDDNEKGRHGECEEAGRDHEARFDHVGCLWAEGRSEEHSQDSACHKGKNYFRSRQLGPTLVSTRRGTRRVWTPSMTSFTSLVRRGISFCGPSKSNSSWTCRIIFDS